MVLPYLITANLQDCLVWIPLVHISPTVVGGGSFPRPVGGEKMSAVCSPSSFFVPRQQSGQFVHVQGDVEFLFIIFMNYNLPLELGKIPLALSVLVTANRNALANPLKIDSILW